MSYTRVAESRAYDAVFDTTYTDSFTRMTADPRVTAAVSSAQMVAGQSRYKYFRRPNMPRLTAVPPNILLAPTVVEKNVKRMEAEAQEPNAKDAEVQTMYRDSEAQTNPYTPDYVIKEGDVPEVLLLKDLTYEKGLPLGKKEVRMVEFARAKKETEMSLPPFTDEASLAMRKRLMERQEMAEFRLRESEIDAKREERLAELREALEAQAESNEFMASERVEAIRLSRTEEREKALERIRNKRIKVLRRLARQRGLAEPALSSDTGKDIISDYFDKGSTIYAPLKRDGQKEPAPSEKFEIASRTAPLNTMHNLDAVEAVIPKNLLVAGNVAIDALKGKEMMSRSMPGGVIRVAQERLTSVAQRALRQTKKDVEEMHQILQRKKHANLIRGPSAEKSGTAGTGAGAGHAPASASSPDTAKHKPITPASHHESLVEGLQTPAEDESRAFAGMRRNIKRPPTPDITADEEGKKYQDSQTFFAAVMLLQRLVRGRAVQNVMYEGRFRRRELIAELRRADEYRDYVSRRSAAEIAEDDKAARERKIKDTTIDAVAGGVSSTLFMALQEEQQRVDTLDSLQAAANAALRERYKLEAAEGGRRQKENLAMPKGK